MAARRILYAVAWIAGNVARDLLDAGLYVLAIALVTSLLAMALPPGVAFAVALLGVSGVFGHRRARAIERADERNEHR